MRQELVRGNRNSSCRDDAHHGGASTTDTTIPIVFVSRFDPVGLGFVDSLQRPGGNLTGVINNEATVTGKWLEFLKEIAPGTARAAILFNPITAPYAEYFLKTLRAIRSASGIEAIRNAGSR